MRDARAEACDQLVDRESSRHGTEQIISPKTSRNPPSRLTPLSRPLARRFYEDRLPFPVRCRRDGVAHLDLQVQPAEVLAEPRHDLPEGLFVPILPAHRLERDVPARVLDRLKLLDHLTPRVAE